MAHLPLCLHSCELFNLSLFSLAPFVTPAEQGQPRGQQHHQRLEFVATVCEAFSAVFATVAAIAFVLMVPLSRRREEQQQVQADPAQAEAAVAPAPSHALPAIQAQPAPPAAPSEAAPVPASEGVRIAVARPQQRQHAQAEETALPPWAVALAPWASLLVVPLLIARFGNFGRPI